MTSFKEDFDPFTILGSFTPDRFHDDDFPDEEENNVIQALESLFEDARNNKMERQRVVEQNILLLKGERLIAYNRVDNSVLRIIRQEDPRAKRSTDNILLKNHRAFVGKFTRALPMPKALPRSGSREDILAADIIDSFVDYFYLSQHLKVLYKRWVEAISATGTGIIRLQWDPSKGPTVSVCDVCEFSSRDAQVGDDCPQCNMAAMEVEEQNAAGQQKQDESQILQIPTEPFEPQEVPEVPQLEAAREGDLEADTIQFRDFFPDPGARVKPGSCTWAFVVDVMHIAKARELFPDMAEHIQEEEGLYSDRYIFAPTGLIGARVETRPLADHVQIRTFYQLPSGLHPKGQIIHHTTSGRVLRVSECVEAKLLGRLPFFFARGDIDEDVLWGMDIISQAEPQQRERDDLVTQLRSWRGLTMNAKVLKSTRSGIHIKRFSDEPGEIITGTQIDENNLRFMRPPEIPSYVPGELNRLDEAVRAKFGTTEQEMGRGDPGQSGRFAAIVEAQASETIAPLVLEVNTEWLEFVRAAVVIAQYYMNNERIWTVAGQDRVMTNSWGRANVLPGWNVYMSNIDATSRNPVVREQMARERLGVGYYTDNTTGRPDWDRYRRDAGIDPGITTGDDDSAEHVRAAQLPELIEEAMMAGQPPPQTQPWDNAFIFAKELLVWLRTTGPQKPEPVRRAVALMWFEYSMTLMPKDPAAGMDPDVARIMPNQSLWESYNQPPEQSDGMGAGGSQPGQQVGDAKPGAGIPGELKEAGSIIQAADQLGESLARPGSKHES